jgi:hypothetical protein
MISSDRSGRAFAAAQADILVRIFGECRGMRAIQLHYRALDPLKFIIASRSRAFWFVDGARAVTNSSIAAMAKYWAVRPDGAPAWGARFVLTFRFPK